MQVHIGYVLFPVKVPLSSSYFLKNEDIMRDNVKRLKVEECVTSIEDTTIVSLLQISAEAVIEAIHKALHQHMHKEETMTDSLHIDVQVHSTGKGASFCFVPGILSMSLTTPTQGFIQCPKDVTTTYMQKAALFPQMTELTIVLPDGNIWDSLPVYWETREVIMTPTVTGHSLTPNAKEDSLSGEDIFFQKRLLVVGAGGIGCELLKVLVLYGFLNLDVFDLDTIDATNLNRQFLFQKEDVGASKADTARKSILNWFSSTCSQRIIPTIRAHHADIRSDTYDDAFFRQFALVLNALDNIAARQHVNRMCMRVGIPLIESGTMGYNGQVQPIVRGRYECYDCHPKAVNQQTVAVCTIHARPTTMVHCVHYAKELYERLFGDTQRDNNDEFAFVDIILNQHQPGDMNNKVNKGTSALCDLAVALARSLFHEKIHELLSMKSTWATEPPVPLATDVIYQCAEEMMVHNAAGKLININRDDMLSVEEIVILFLSAFGRCAQRHKRSTFRKEDDDTVDFVAAVANLRAVVFHISPLQSVEEIRSIAGAIVPAVATTNAIVAAAVVQQALCVLHMNEGTCHFALPQMIYVRRVPQVRRRRLLPVCCEDNHHHHHNNSSNNNNKHINNCGKDVRERQWTTDLFLVHSAPPNSPSSACVVCRDCHPTVHVFLNATHITLGHLVHNVIGGRLSMSSASVFYGANVLYEEGEYETLATTLLTEWMTADTKSLDLLIDDLDHEVVWRLVVMHCVEMGENDTIRIEGIDAALQLEQSLIAEAKTISDDGNDKEEKVSSMRREISGNVSTVVVLTDSDEDDGDDVVEID